MQSIVNLTTTVARLESAIGSMSDKIDDVRDAQESLQGRIDKVERKMLIASTIFTIVIAIAGCIIGTAGFVANKAIDFGLEMAKDRILQPAEPAPTAPPLEPAQK